MHHREREAAIDPPTVDQNCASSALTVIATLFGSGEVESFPQCIEYRNARVYVQLIQITVYA
jgi:hypothetical protein